MLILVISNTKLFVYKHLKAWKQVFCRKVGLEKRLALLRIRTFIWCTDPAFQAISNLNFIHVCDITQQGYIGLYSTFTVFWNVCCKSVIEIRICFCKSDLWSDATCTYWIEPLIHYIACGIAIGGKFCIYHVYRHAEFSIRPTPLY